MRGPEISIIIPTYNEACIIASLIQYLVEFGSERIHEIVVADGGSTDKTRESAEKAGAVVIDCPQKGRARQMNYAVKYTSGEILYFLHADTYPPETYASDIIHAMENSGSGGFRLQFDHPHWFLRLNAWFTRFDVDFFRFGDQSLFVKKDIFEKAGGFKDELIFLEDQEIIQRLKKIAHFIIIPKTVQTSARKYMENGIYRLQFYYSVIWILWKTGAPQPMLLKKYKNWVRQNKI